jgi:hypothetical protein
MRTQFKIAAALYAALAAFAGSINLRRAAVVVGPGDVPAPERTAATVLVEELEKRSGVRLPVVSQWPAGAAPVVWVDGSDARGALYGVGHLLRQIEWGKDRLSLTTPLDVTTSPVSAIRGHQLGYRSTANSWDAWTVPQFESHIRELALFGINSVENIPFQDDRKNPLMKAPRREMNRQLAGICARYGLDYWVWTPASFDLNDRQQRERLLAAFDELFRDVPVLRGIFFPGGDPGDNPPEPVLAFLEEIARHMRPLHRKAKVWLSMQGFSPQKAEVVYQYLDRQVPEWLGGIVAGPSSPPIPETRRGGFRRV